MANVDDGEPDKKGTVADLAARPPHFVIAGRDPAIQAALAQRTVLDHRVKPDDDERGIANRLNAGASLHGEP